MHSSSADCVLGDARLISSPTTRLANTAPGLNSKSRVSWLYTLTPVTSDGSRSGVNWMRRTEQSIDRASALASIVLPTPGTSSIKTCPSASRAMRARRTTSGLPSMTRWILARILSKVAARSSIPPISGRVVATGRAPFHDSFLVFDSRRVCEDFRFAPPGNRETSWLGDLSAAPRSMWGGARSPPRPPKRLCHGDRAGARARLSSADGANLGDESQAARRRPAGLCRAGLCQGSGGGRRHRRGRGARDLLRLFPEQAGGAGRAGARARRHAGGAGDEAVARRRRARQPGRGAGRAGRPVRARRRHAAAVDRGGGARPGAGGHPGRGAPPVRGADRPQRRARRQAGPGLAGRPLHRRHRAGGHGRADAVPAGQPLTRCGPAEVWLWLGDITDLAVEAIVNAANNQGWLGSGVAGAIRRAAGDEVEAEAVAQGPWEVGGAVRTGPGRLSLRGVKSILHAAAMGAGVRATPASVAAATGAALDLAAAEGLSSIALPALGTGVGGLAYPDCAAAMAGALRRHCAGPSSLRLVVFALYEAAAVEEFAPALVHDLDG